MLLCDVCVAFLGLHQSIKCKHPTVFLVYGGNDCLVVVGVRKRFGRVRRQKSASVHHNEMLDSFEFRSKEDMPWHQTNNHVFFKGYWILSSQDLPLLLNIIYIYVYYTVVHPVLFANWEQSAYGKMGMLIHLRKPAQYSLTAWSAVTLVLDVFLFQW